MKCPVLTCNKINIFSIMSHSFVRKLGWVSYLSFSLKETPKECEMIPENGLSNPLGCQNFGCTRLTALYKASILATLLQPQGSDNKLSKEKVIKVH